MTRTLRERKPDHRKSEKKLYRVTKIKIKIKKTLKLQIENQLRQSKVCLTKKYDSRFAKKAVQKEEGSAGVGDVLVFKVVDNGVYILEELTMKSMLKYFKYVNFIRLF